MVSRSKKVDVEAFKPPNTWFDRWWEPESFLAEVQIHSEPVPRVLLFNHPELKQLREALAAALFAELRLEHTPLSIRLEPDRFPDFQIRTNGGIEPFELVEADRMDRRRGKEYREAAEREAAGLQPEWESFDPVEERQAGVEAIARVLQEKAAKHYKPAPNLLVYVNFLLFEKVSFSLSESQLLISLCQDRFPSTWLLWGQSVAQISPRFFRVRNRKPDD